MADVKGTTFTGSTLEYAYADKWGRAGAFVILGSAAAEPMTVSELLPVPTEGFPDDFVSAKYVPITFRLNNPKLAFIFLRYEDSDLTEVIWNGGIFMPRFLLGPSTRTVVGDDWDFSILPVGGWLRSIACFNIVGVDANGNAINIEMVG